MPWGRMDDKFHRNHKVRALRREKGWREALGVWTFWWSWCLDDPELNGFVPAEELHPSDRKGAALLVKAGLWDVADGGYVFHDFHEWNPTLNQVESKREADRKRVAEKRAASRDDVARDTDATSARVASTRASHPNPSQSQPDPIPSDTPDGWDENVARELYLRWFDATFGRPPARPPSIASPVLGSFVRLAGSREGASRYLELVARDYHLATRKTGSLDAIVDPAEWDRIATHGPGDEFKNPLNAPKRRGPAFAPPDEAYIATPDPEWLKPDPPKEAAHG